MTTPREGLFRDNERNNPNEHNSFKVFRYSFFGTIPNFLNRLLDSPFLVRSTWNLQCLLVLDWTLAWCTFCENRYFHDNDKQKTLKTLKLKFSAIQISLWKANTNILNCGVWHNKIYKNKKNLYVCFEVFHKNIFNLNFCTVIVNALKNN